MNTQLTTRKRPGRRPRNGAYPLPLLGFGVWLEHQILHQSRYGRSPSYYEFIMRYKLRRVKEWIYDRPPHPAIANDLAPALTDWTGRAVSVAEVRRAIDPSLERDPETFGEWLRQVIERKGTVCAFSYRYNFPYSTVRNWVRGSSVVPVNCIPILSNCLTVWSKCNIDEVEIRRRIDKDSVMSVQIKTIGH